MAKNCKTCGYWEYKVTECYYDVYIDGFRSDLVIKIFKG